MGKVNVLVALCALLGNMLRVCVLGHSLVPTFIPLNSSRNSSLSWSDDCVINRQTNRP